MSIDNFPDGIAAYPTFISAAGARAKAGISKEDGVFAAIDIRTGKDGT